MVQDVLQPLKEIRASFRRRPSPSDDEKANEVLRCFSESGIPLTPAEVQEIVATPEEPPTPSKDGARDESRTTAGILGKILLGSSPRQVHLVLDAPR